MFCDTRIRFGIATIGTLNLAEVATFGLMLKSITEDCAMTEFAPNREDSATKMRGLSIKMAKKIYKMRTKNKRKRKPNEKKKIVR